MELHEEVEGVICKQRNVIVVGKSRSGNSTVANSILGHELFKISSSLDGETKKADHGE